MMLGQGRLARYTTVIYYWGKKAFENIATLSAMKFVLESCLSRISPYNLNIRYILILSLKKKKKSIIYINLGINNNLNLIIR